MVLEALGLIWRPQCTSFNVCLLSYRSKIGGQSFVKYDYCRKSPSVDRECF